ncbi:hypothetical protein C5167_045528 [Papaver somniferum]|uniref:Uncharacterized protein n=1 Tax=Papaver somniferum TaxID=3469 RepID=A0A4Y7LB65_PAPSO|nr:hypothetical protein C5167_045528 [Papaver somniferum]
MDLGFLEQFLQNLPIWVSATNQVRDEPIDADSNFGPVMVGVCWSYVKYYQGIRRKDLCQYLLNQEWGLFAGFSSNSMKIAEVELMSVS